MSPILSTPDGFLTALVTLAAIGTACAVLSVFVVLLKWSFIGDGISHAGIGGAGAAALLSLAVPVLAGDAASYGVEIAFCFATAAAIGWVSRRRAVSGDAAIGVFVVASLAFGFLAFDVRAHALGPGAGSFPDRLLVGTIDGISARSMLSAVSISSVVLLISVLLGRQILLYCFDATLAQVSGVPVAAIHYLLIFLITLTIVASMKLLGNLLAPALLILPGALALSLSARLKTVMTLSIGATLAAVAVGLLVAARWRFIEAGPCIVLVLFLEFAASLLPRRRR